MNRLPVHLLLRLSIFYAAALLIGTATLTWVNNILINGITLEKLLKFNLKALLVGDVLMLVLLILISSFRLRSVKAYWKGAFDEESARKALQSLYRFPLELFWGMLGLSLLFSLLYDAASMLYQGVSPFRVGLVKWEKLLLSLLTEMTLASTIAILLFIFSRSSLRPYIIHIQNSSGTVPLMRQRRQNGSFVRPFLITFVVGFFIMSSSMLNYVYTKADRNQEPLIRDLVLIAAYYTVMGGCLFGLQAVSFRRELRTIITSYRAFLRGADSGLIVQRLPVLAEDELGRLASSVNRFRSRMLTEYDRLQQELRLASKVQRKLMPTAYLAAGQVEIVAECRQSDEVGGDLYDIVPLDRHRIAVINGDVSGKGLPAALVMSAVMVLFRAEMRSGGTAGEIMTRLNRILTETLKGDMFVTLGIAIVDTLSHQVEYSSAGHMAPYVVYDGSVRQIDCSSLPAGIDEDEVYVCQTISLAPGERFLLYTDGIVEAMDNNGNMFGFEQFESLLSQLHREERPSQQLHALISTLPMPASGVLPDDWTVVIIGRCEAEVKAEDRKDSFVSNL